MSDNMIKNGDFEKGKTGWNFTHQASGVIEGSEEITVTNRYCKISTTEAIYQQLAVTAGDTVHVSLSSRGSLAGTVSFMQFATNTTYWSDTFNEYGNSKWTDETFSFTVDSAWEGPFMIHFRAAYSATSDDAVEVDNIVVTN